MSAASIDRSQVCRTVCGESGGRSEPLRVISQYCWQAIKGISLLPMNKTEMAKTIVDLRAAATIAAVHEAMGHRRMLHAR